MPRVPMLIDCDPGVDDAVALLAAARLSDLVGITTVNGNVGLEHTTHNALAVAQIADLDVPVHRGADRPLVADPVAARHVHGATGLGTVTLPALERAVESTDAVEFILETSERVADLHLVAVGPLTNIAAALREDPSLPSRLGGFTIMGGAAGTGNVTPTAEFNVWADPEAADLVFRLGGPLTMVGLDVTHQVRFGANEVARLRQVDSPVAALAAELIEFAMTRAAELRGWDAAPVHDATAVIAALEPSLFWGDAHPVAVELDGTRTRGMTVVDDRGRASTGEATVTVLRQVDAAATTDRVIDAVIALGGT